MRIYLKYINNLSYTLKHSARARCLRITVRCDASVVVTVPRFFSHSNVEKFLADKSVWILKKIAYFKKIGRDGLVIARRSGVGEYRKLKQEARIFVKEK